MLRALHAALAAEVGVGREDVATVRAVHGGPSGSIPLSPLQNSVMVGVQPVKLVLGDRPRKKIRRQSMSQPSNPRVKEPFECQAMKPPAYRAPAMPAVALA